MSGKRETIKKNNGTGSWRNRLQRIASETGNSILTAYFIVMMIVYPLYFKNGYQEIGNVKYYFFRNVSLVMAGSMLLVTVCIFVVQINRTSIAAYYRRLSVTDWFVYGYLLAMLLSYLFTAFKKEAIWGATGWYMGLISQLLFIGIYFWFSRYFKWSEKISYALIGTVPVFLLGILNRYSVYPIPMNGNTPAFISTLGNINWFCGYWAVLFPMGIMLYWCSERGLRRAAAAVYVVTGFLSGVTQGSSSAYLALAAVFIMLFCISFSENQKMQRFLEICVLFALSCQIARLFRYLPDFKINYENQIGNVLTDTNLTLYLGILTGAVYLLFRYASERKNYQIAQHKEIRSGLLILLTVILAGYLILLIGNTCLPDGIPGLSDMGFFLFNDEWANYRGVTWTSGLLAYWKMSALHKAVGVGPDCFAQYLYAVPGLAEHIYEQFGSSRLTNAHNEWITVLVNQGMIGMLCYAGIFLSAFTGFMKKAQARPVLYLCAASVLTYTVHNMVSFQQILNTPFVFMVLGIGEGIRRK